MTSKEIYQQNDPDSEDKFADDDNLIVILPDDIELGQITDGEFVEDSLDPSSTPGLEPGFRKRKWKRSQPSNRALELKRELDGEIENELNLTSQVYETVLTTRWIYRALGAFAFAGLALLLTIGWSYYTTAIHQRPLHYLHEALRPSSQLGLGLGILGTGIMLVSMTYVLRKHILSPRKWGSLQSWMNFHIFTGFLGPAVALFHASFIPRSALGLLAISSMLIVVISGVVGRYILRQLPRSIEGKDLDLLDVQRRLKLYRGELLAHYVAPDLLKLEQKHSKLKDWFWLYYALTGIVLGNRESHRDYEKICSTIDPKAQAKESGLRLKVVAKKFCRERQWLHRYRELKKLMNAWRFFHQWMAVVLFAAIAFHIVVALFFGKLW